MESKKTKIISIVAVVALALTVITATYAYFNASIGDSAAADVKINANTVDTFTFSSGSAISFSINQENFASGAGNQSESTYASALLTANNKTNTATEHYYLYLKIEKNTFTYSINERTPEIIMTITDSTGTEVTDMSTLNHVIVTGANGTQVSGYDITNKSGLITLFDNREITTTSSKEEKWNITITFVNYDENQNANAGKSMSAKVMIQKEEEKIFLADYVKTLYTGTQGENSVYYHNGTITTDDGTIIDAGDNSYRYAGSSETVNNYICLGSTASPCPDNNLFRIIGVFGDKVKVIKVKFLEENDVWDSNGSNTWSTSSLNIYLKETYLPSLGTLGDKIAISTWKVGGNTVANIIRVISSVAYQNEIVNPATDLTYEAKIGLMYVSDYGFAAAPSAWSKKLENYDGNDDNGVAIKNINWLSGLGIWTITRISDGSYTVFIARPYGHVDGNPASSRMGCHPVFNLISSVTYAGGSGTQSDPIIIG